MHHTVQQLATLLKVSDERILFFIRSGRLKAVNVGNGEIRPRWRVSEENLRAFIESRSTTKPTTKRRKSAASSEVSYF